MSDAHRTSPEALACAIAGFGLRADGAVLPTVTAGDWGPLLARVSSERLAGIALAAEAQGALTIPSPFLDRLIDLHRDAMMWAVNLERTLCAALVALADEGIEPVLLKGPAMAHTRYADPSWRPFADLDLLVGGSQRAGASAALSRAGFLPSRPEPRRGFDDRFGKAVVHRDTQGVEIDLHRTLAQGPFVAWIDPAVLVERAVPFTVAGVTTRRLDDTGLFLHACVHASLGGRRPNLLMLRDVAQTWEAPGVDWDLVDRLARAWRLGAVLRHACLMTSSTFEVGMPEPVRGLIAPAPARREVRALRAYTGPRRGRGGTELALLAALPGLRARTAYAASLLVPSRAFLRARAGATGGRATYSHRWTVAAQAIGQKGRA